jgi:type II secretory pathway predicted ATPase ExeA
MTESHREVLLNLEYGIASGKGITLLIGEAGSGKTTMIRAAIDRQPGRVHCVNLQNPTLSRTEFNEMLATHFELSAQASQSKAVMLTELERLLRERIARDEPTVLIVDEAQSLPMDLLEEIRLLANFETHERKLLSVIIAGQPELAHRLNDRSLRQFKQRVALRCELRSLTSQETAAYVVGRSRGGGLHPPGRRPHARALRRHPSHDQRDRGQRPAGRFCGRPPACRCRPRCRDLPRLRHWSPCIEVVAGATGWGWRQASISPDRSAVRRR